MRSVSVIIPAHNAEATIATTLASLVPDAGLIGEILLINDGSHDATAARATAAAAGLGLPLTVHRVRAGNAGAARNSGLDRAACPFAYFIDADDHLLPGGIAALMGAMQRGGDAGLAVGASVRKTRGMDDLVRTPSGYGADPIANADLYLLNGAPPISMGSGLVRMAAVSSIRFPETIAIDEDTWFWSALLASAPVAVTAEPVLHYHLDAQRTALRYLDDPGKSWLAIVQAFRRLEAFGVSGEALRWRRAWLAQRFARQLIKHARYDEAAAMLRPVMAHERLAREWRTIRYRAISAFGRRLRHRDCRPPPGEGPHRTLVLCHDAPWPPVSGADLRNVQNAAASAAMGPTHLVSLHARDDTGDTAPGFSLATLARPDEPRGRSVNWPRSLAEPRISQAMLDRLLDEVARFRPDTVVIEGIGLQAVIGPLRTRVTQLVLDMHNIESDLARQTGAPRRLKTRARIALLASQEKRALRAVDRVWTCTREDRDHLIATHGHRSRIDVVPNGIPRFDAIPPELASKTPNADAPVVLFAGHLGYPPNIDAAVRLARAIFPAIRDAFPAATLLVAGRYPKPSVRALAELPGVELHDNPHDLSPLLARADLSVMPLAAGGGSRIKIVEAAAWGIPVVATPLAAQGLNLDPGRHIVLAEGDGELARQAIALLRDASRWAALRAEARDAVVQSFGPLAIRRAVSAGLGLDTGANESGQP